MGRKEYVYHSIKILQVLDMQSRIGGFPKPLFMPQHSA
jgi:hypothetical protein